MKNSIKRFIFATITSSLLLSSLAMGASLVPTVSVASDEAASIGLYQRLISFIYGSPARVSARASSGADAKESVAAVRRIVQLPGLLQHDDHLAYKKYNLCGFYTAFFVTKMMRAAGSGDYSLLVDRSNFNGFIADQELQPNIEDREILKIIHTKIGSKDKEANVACVGQNQLDSKGGFIEGIEQLLNALDNKSPIGLIMNIGGVHWIAGMVTIDDAGVVLRVVDSMGHDCAKEPVVIAAYDCFLKKAQGVQRAVADSKKAAEAARLLEAETKRAAELLEQQRIQARQREAEQAKIAEEIAKKAEAEEREKRAKQLAEQQVADEKYVQEMLKREAAAASSASSRSCISSSNASSVTLAAIPLQRASSHSAVSDDAKLAQALADEAATAAMVKQLQAEADAEVASRVQQQQLQEQRDLALARTLSGQHGGQS